MCEKLPATLSKIDNIEPVKR